MPNRESGQAAGLAAQRVGDKQATRAESTSESSTDICHCTYSIPYMSAPIPVDAISYTAARANLAQTMNRVCGDHEPLIITRNGQPSVVMLSLDDYKALEETAYLLRSPANARRLLDAIDRLEAGLGQERALKNDPLE